MTDGPKALRRGSREAPQRRGIKSGMDGSLAEGVSEIAPRKMFELSVQIYAYWRI